jgi:hypothetical protein
VSANTFLDLNKACASSTSPSGNLLEILYFPPFSGTAALPADCRHFRPYYRNRTQAHVPMLHNMRSTKL